MLIFLLLMLWLMELNLVCLGEGRSPDGVPRRAGEEAAPVARQQGPHLDPASRLTPLSWILAPDGGASGSESSQNKVNQQGGMESGRKDNIYGISL